MNITFEDKALAALFFTGTTAAKMAAHGEQREEEDVTIPVSDRNLLRNLSRPFGWACMH